MPEPILEYRSPHEPSMRPQNVPARTSLVLAVVLPVAIISAIAVGGTAGGCFWKLGPIASVAAICFGVSGLRRAREINGEGVNTARWGIGLGVAGVVTTAVLFIGFIIMFNRSYERLYRLKCAANLQRIHSAINTHSQANGGLLPQRLDQLLDQLSAETFVCMSSADEDAPGATTRAVALNLAKPQHCSYTYLGAGMTWPAGAGVVLAYEDRENHDGDGIHVLFGDGVVKWYSAKEAEELLKKMRPAASMPVQ